MEVIYCFCCWKDLVLNLCLEFEQAKEFYSRPVSDKYAVVYCDTTYLNLRCDSITKEALHVILGIASDRCKEVLDYALYPAETTANYEEKVLLLVYDGLIEMKNTFLRQFPNAKHQSFWVI